MADLDPPKEGTPLLVVGTQANPLQHVLGRNPWFKLATLVVALCAVVAVGAIYTRTRATSGTLDAGFAPSCREHDSMNPLPAKQSYPVHIIQYGHPRTATTLQYQVGGLDRGALKTFLKAKPPGQATLFLVLRPLERTFLTPAHSSTRNMLRRRCCVR